MYLEDYIEEKDDALQTIIDIGYDYDGQEGEDNLKSLIDELVDIAHTGLNVGNDNSVYFDNQELVELIEMRDDLVDKQLALDEFGANDRLFRHCDTITDMVLDELDIPNESDNFCRDSFYMTIMDDTIPANERIELLLDMKEEI